MSLITIVVITIVLVLMNSDKVKCVIVTACACMWRRDPHVTPGTPILVKGIDRNMRVFTILT